MNVNHIEEDKRGYFIALEDSVEVGRITYVMSGDTKLIINHTEVNPTYEGNGIGRKLVFAVVGYARDHGMKILPLCTFAKAIFDKTPEIKDVLF